MKQRDNLKDARAYLELSRQASMPQTLKNKSIYQGYRFVSMVVGVIAAVAACLIGVGILVASGMPDATASRMTRGVMIGSIGVGYVGYRFVLAQFTENFIRAGLRPFFVVEDEKDDPMVGRMYRSAKNRIVTIYARTGPHYYRTYYVEDGIQHNNGDLLASRLAEVEFLPPDSAGDEAAGV